MQRLLQVNNRLLISLILSVLAIILAVAFGSPERSAAGFTPRAFQSPIKTPTPLPSPSPAPVPPTTCPPQTRWGRFEANVTVEGLGAIDVAEVELLPDISVTDACLTTYGVVLPKLRVQNENRRITVANIPDGSYKLVIHAPSDYFRKPQGYLFQVQQGQIVKTSDHPLDFKLIPPSKQQIPPCRDYSEDSTQQQDISPNDISAEECMAEGIIDISGPHKAPAITNQYAPDATYFYAHVHDTSTSWGVWGRMSVSDPAIPHGSDNRHIVEHVYATLDYNKWIEAGWAEVNWRDDRQYIFEFDSTNQTWNFYDQYSIAKGDKVTVLVQNDGGTYWKARLYRSGVYNVLAQVDVGFTSVPHSFNGFENASVPGDSSIMPPSHFDEAYLYNGTLWRTWDTTFLSTSSTQADPPFLLDMKRQFYDFYVNSPIVFVPLILKDAQ